MEQFSLEKYLANPSRKVVTRDGRNIRIICTDRRDLHRPIIALMENEVRGGEVEVEREITIYYTKDGKYNGNGCLSNFDLFFAPEKHEGWVNIYKSKYDGYELSQVYQRKEDAETEKYINDSDVYITTTKIEWKE